MNKPTTHKKIDYVLNLLYSRNTIVVEDKDIYEYLTLSEISEKQKLLEENEIHTILQFLVDAQLVLTEDLEVGFEYRTLEPHYKLSIKGLLFIEQKTSFVKENRRYKRKQFYEKAKIVAIVLNALAILALMYWGVLVAISK